MKKILLLVLSFYLIIFSLTGYAQGINTLNQNFDATCAIATLPSDWSVYNPISATIPYGQWSCTPGNGRPDISGGATPGMRCSGTYSSAYHLDTSFFITPLFNLSTYTGQHIYLRFDTKKENIIIGGKLDLIKSQDFSFHTIDSVSTAATPAFSDFDSTGWVTHQADLTNYIGTGSFYMAFRYTSTNTTGTAWYLDNVSLTTVSLDVAIVNKDILPLTVIGNSTSSHIDLSYTAYTAGMYLLAIYDMVGSKVYNTQIAARAGTASYSISGLGLHPGMYCIKMGNEHAYGTIKLMIR